MRFTSTKELIEAMEVKSLNDAPIIVYSLSKHGEYAQNIMNQLVDTHATWKNTLLALALYPLQKWACHSRDSMGINWDYFDDDEFSYFGINGYKELILKQKSLLIATDNILNIVDKMLEDESINEKLLLALRSIHGFDKKQIYDYVSSDDGSYVIEKEKMSKFYLEKYYQKALETVCKKYSREINKIAKSISISLPTDEDIKVVYHDADRLLNVCRKLNKTSSYKYFDNVNIELLNNQISNCVESLNTYPFKSKDVHLVLSNQLNGKSKACSLEQLGRSRQYLYDRYNEGIAALSMLLWGYSSSQIIGYLDAAKTYR